MEPASGDGLGAVAVAADQQFGRGGDEGGVAAAGAEDVTGVKARAEDAEDRGGVVRRGRVDGDLAGEDDLFEGACADAFDGAGDRGLVVLGRRHGVDPEAARRVRGRAAEAGRGFSAAARALRRAASSSGTSSGAAECGER